MTKFEIGDIVKIKNHVKVHPSNFRNGQQKDSYEVDHIHENIDMVSLDGIFCRLLVDEIELIKKKNIINITKKHIGCQVKFANGEFGTINHIYHYGEFTVEIAKNKDCEVMVFDTQGNRINNQSDWNVVEILEKENTQTEGNKPWLKTVTKTEIVFGEYDPCNNETTVEIDKYNENNIVVTINGGFFNKKDIQNLANFFQDLAQNM